MYINTFSLLNNPLFPAVPNLLCMVIGLFPLEIWLTKGSEKIDVKSRSCVLGYFKFSAKSAKTIEVYTYCEAYCIEFIQLILMKLDKDEIPMTPYQCCCFRPVLHRNKWIYGDDNLGNGGSSTDIQP